MKGVILLKSLCPKPRKVYFWWSASYVHEALLVGWKRIKFLPTIGDTLKLGVGAVIYSNWMFSTLTKKQRNGLPKNHYLLQPHTTLYVSNPWRNSKARKVRRPTLTELYT